MSEHSVEDIIAAIEDYQVEAVAKAKKDLNSLDIKKSLEGGLHPATSITALGNLMVMASDVEQILYDLSIIRLELRLLKEEVPSNDTVSQLSKTLRKCIAAVNECHAIATSRYNHVSSVLTAVRSVNSNFRTAGINQVGHGGQERV